jgi:hypothetical protein
VSLISKGAVAFGLGLLMALSGCATPPKTDIDSQQIHKNADKSFQEMEKEEKKQNGY